jgi:hypothetical protein
MLLSQNDPLCFALLCLVLSAEGYIAVILLSRGMTDLDLGNELSTEDIRPSS